MTVEAIVFDCDGVLIDSERIAHEVLIEALAEFGWQLDFAEAVRRFKGLSAADTVRAIEAHLGRRLPGDFIELEQQRCLERFAMGLQPVPGVVAVLENLVLPRCVASSSSPERLARCLEQTGLANHFGGHVYSAHQVARGKPFPDLFLYGARQLGVEPSRCVVIEDSVAGVQAAVHAGMQVLGYTDLTPAASLQAAGAEVFEHMSELPDLLPGAF